MTYLKRFVEFLLFFVLYLFVYQGYFNLISSLFGTMNSIFIFLLYSLTPFVALVSVGFLMLKRNASKPYLLGSVLRFSILMAPFTTWANNGVYRYFYFAENYICSAFPHWIFESKEGGRVCGGVERTGLVDDIWYADYAHFYTWGFYILGIATLIYLYMRLKANAQDGPSEPSPQSA